MFIIECGRKHYSEKIKSAIRRNDRETILTLLKDCYPAKVKDHEDSTLLHLAVKISNWKIINFLINIGCDVNAQDQMGRTPLLAALEAVDFPIMKKLLRAKTNIFISDNKGINILNTIFKFDEDLHREILILMIIKRIRECGLNAKKLAIIMMEAEWPLRYAVLIKNSEVIKSMLDAGCDVDTYDDCGTALHYTISSDDVKTTKILLEYGADIDIIHEDLDSPFEMAIVHIRIFETFLKHKPILERFNTDGSIRNHEIFLDADSHIIKLLLDYKVNLTKLDSHGVTLLHILVLSKDQEVINLIMKLEIDVNIKDIRGNTPLHSAIEVANIECIKGLINKGADVNAINERGETPLIKAIYVHAEQEKIDLLVESSILNEEMQNILLKAVVTTNIPLSKVSLLLKRLAIMHFQVEALSKRNLNIINNSSSIDSLFALYLRELNSMKQDQVIDRSNISVFDILCASEQKLINLARNIEIVAKFHEIDFDLKYRIFGERIEKRFKSAYLKQTLIKNAVNIVSENIKQLNFNLEVAEHIVKFLSQDDLLLMQIKPLENLSFCNNN